MRRMHFTTLPTLALLAACAGGSPMTPEPSAPAAAPSAAAPAETGYQRLTGVARDAKGSAILEADDGRVLYLRGLDAWPGGVVGRKVVVGGTVGSSHILPEAEVLPDGAITQGVAPGSGPQLVVDGAEWSFAERPASGLAPAPWEIRYADGAGNLTRMGQGAPGEPISWSYTPVTPETSSSGTYSGGEPAEGTLEEGAALAIWAKAAALLEHTELYVGGREMGTGSLLMYAAEEGERSMIFKRGEAVDAFEAALAELRAPAGSASP